MVESQKAVAGYTKGEKNQIKFWQVSSKKLTLKQGLKKGVTRGKFKRDLVVRLRTKIVRSAGTRRRLISNEVFEKKLKRMISARVDSNHGRVRAGRD